MFNGRCFRNRGKNRFCKNRDIESYKLWLEQELNEVDKFIKKE